MDPPPATPVSTEPPPEASQPPPPPSSAPPTSDPSPPPSSPTLQSPLQLNHNRPPSSFTHFPSSSSSAMARGGMALGVPAHHHPRPSQPLSSSPFGRPMGSMPMGSMPRGPEQPSSQVRQPIQGIHSIGMIGSLSTGSQMRASGILGQTQRLGQSSFRATSSSASQSLSSQRFQGHGLMGAPSMTSPSSPSPVPQNSQSFQQPLASVQGKQTHLASLPSSSFKPQIKSQALQQRPHLLQQHHQSPGAISHHQQTLSAQQLQQKHQQQTLSAQASLPHQPQEMNSQQYLALRNQQSMVQQQAGRAHGSTTQKSNVPTIMQSGIIQSGGTTPIINMDAAESGNQIVSKRSIHELVTQIDPSEKLDPEVEDVLVEIAEDFVESITTFACSLAKHRKSTSLEAKDILVHVERTWNMTLPGFGGDEVKCYKKQATNDIHKERLAVIKKSMAGASDAGNAKNTPAGQAATMNRKAPPGKGPAAMG